MEVFIAKEAVIAGHILFSQVIYDAYGQAKDAMAYPQISQAMEQMDLSAYLQEVEALVRKIGKNQGLYIIPDEDDPLTICLHHVEEMVKCIKKDLEEINVQIKAHKEKYFANWRSTGAELLIERLRTHKKTLDSRVNRLTQIMQI